MHLTGEICHCLRIFGIPETDSTLSQGLEYLRSCQQLDGSWPARGDTDVPYFRYHAAMCAVSCLNTKRYRGFGPSDPLLVDDLMEYRYATSEGPQTIMNINDFKKHIFTFNFLYRKV